MHLRHSKPSETGTKQNSLWPPSALLLLPRVLPKCPFLKLRTSKSSASLHQHWTK